jgi:hypothetical protein
LPVAMNIRKTFQVVNGYGRRKFANFRRDYCSLEYRGKNRLPTTSCSRGVTLIDTVIGTALMLVVFLGIAAVFKLSVEVVTNNKARAGAIAIANERMEYIRSLTYASIGTAGGVPSGTILQSETVLLNGISYTRRTVVEYVDDPNDGIGSADTNGITIDYKVAKVEVAWNSRVGTRYITLVTRISPPNGMEVACPPTALCGTLTIYVLNVATQPVLNAHVRIVNTTTSPGIDLTTYTNTAGVVSIVGAPVATGYQVTATKSGYSTDQTYNVTSENTNPSPGPLTVSNNQTTNATFRIDVLASKTILTFTQVLSGVWSEHMSGESKIATSTNITVSNGIAHLSEAPAYSSYGELQSISIGPSSLAKWKTLTLAHDKPAETNIVYRIYNGSGTDLIPDSDLPGNSTGLATSSSIVDLSNISTSTYPAIRLDATLTTENPSQTPSIEGYEVSYDYGPLPLSNIALNMLGTKTIGSGPGGTLYKYNANLNSGASGVITLSNMEWDTYTITDNGAITGYDIASSCSPQPEALNPADNAITKLYFAPHSTDSSLLVDVKSAAGTLVQNATVRLYKSGYDTSQESDSCGQSFFKDISTAIYSVTVTATGYQTYASSNVSVSGTTRLSVTLD